MHYLQLYYYSHDVNKLHLTWNGISFINDYKIVKSDYL